MIKDNKKRFSDRVEDYIKYRPSYPDGLISVLEDRIGLNSENVVADIGSGTGLSTIPFLKYGNYVYSVEPNKEMRDAQKQMLKGFLHLDILEGSAEETKLKDDSVDIVFCGQAFHWFRKDLCKKEFSRILKAKGHIVLAWNERSAQSGFQKEYEQILFKQIAEYKHVNHRNIENKDIAGFFYPEKMHLDRLDNYQEFDLEGLKGRLKSSSYCPKEGVVYERLMNELEGLFSKFQVSGRIRFEYETKIYWC